MYSYKRPSRALEEVQGCLDRELRARVPESWSKKGGRKVLVDILGFIDSALCGWKRPEEAFKNMVLEKGISCLGPILYHTYMSL